MSTRSLSRRYLPRGLFGRSLLIIVMPMVLLQAAVSYLLFDRQWESVTLRMARGVSAQIGMIMATYKNVDREQFVRTHELLAIDILVGRHDHADLRRDAARHTQRHRFPLPVEQQIADGSLQQHHRHDDDQQRTPEQAARQITS